MKANILLTLLLCSSFCFANQIPVCNSGCEFTTIQNAVNSASSGYSKIVSVRGDEPVGVKLLKTSAASGMVRFQLNGIRGRVNISVVDMMGNIHLKKATAVHEDTVVEISVQELPAGKYFIQLWQMGKKEKYVFTFIKQ